MSEVLPNVTVYAGPMGAGKTSELFKKMGEFRIRRRAYAAFLPGHDVRESSIYPKNLKTVAENQETNCQIVESLNDIPVDILTLNGIRTVFLEEFHMFGYDQEMLPIRGIYLEMMNRWAKAGIQEVYASGLDLAASGNAFSLFSDAHRYGADIRMFTASCEYPVNGDDKETCGATARNSQIYNVDSRLVYRMETLDDLLPEGHNLNLGFRAVCKDHLILPDDLTIDFEAKKSFRQTYY